MKNKKTCKECNNEFYSYRNEQQYCSYECYKLKIKECLYCKKQYKPIRRNQKFCSKKCNGLNQRVEKKNIQCLYCNKNFNVYKKSNSKYCSRICKDKYQKTLFKGENNPNYGKLHSNMFKHTDTAKKNIQIKVTQQWKTEDRKMKQKIFMDKYKKEHGFYPMQSPVAIKNKTNSLIKFYKDNEQFNTWKYCRRGYYKSMKTNKYEYHHSSYELNRMKELDTDNNVIYWTKKHKIIIKYNNGNNFYKPDFYIEYKNKIVIEEVKGWVKDINIFRKKNSSAIEFCKKNNYEYVVNFMGNKKNYVE